jgi:predicted AAA+ superfamily ATPase
LKTDIPEPIHQKLLKLVREYMVLGGMPAVVQEYLNTQNFSQCQIIQSALLNTYRSDFGKYSTKTNYKYLQQLFERAPGLIAQNFRYSKVDPEMRSRDLKIALEKLRDAGLLYQIFATSATGLPLQSLVDEKRFKILFLDVGLVKRATKLDAEILLQEDLLLINRGALAEQFVGQELLAYGSFYEPAQLYFWTREQRGSTAEIDFIININSIIVPIEVKSGTTGRLKSLRLFMDDKKSQVGVQISQRPLSLEQSILSIPLYMIGELKRLIQTL